MLVEVASAWVEAGVFLGVLLLDILRVFTMLRSWRTLVDFHGYPAVALYTTKGKKQLVTTSSNSKKWVVT